MLSEKTISRNLSRIMAEKGVNANQLSLAARVPYSRVSDIMQGRTKYPRIDTLAPLANELGVTVDALISEDKELKAV